MIYPRDFGGVWVDSIRTYTAEGWIEQPAGGNEDEPAMKLGLPAPIDGETETDGKGGHVKERDDQKRVRARQVQLDGIEAPHHDGRCRAKENHAGPERGAEPARRAVPAHTVRADQRGLQNEENNPPREYGRMNQRGKGRGTAACKRLALTEWLKPQTTIAATNSDIAK